MDPFIINQYFELLKKTLHDLDLNDKPNQIWNLDELGFCLDPSKTKVVGKKGVASSRTTGGVGRENNTGGKAPPIIIFKGKHIWDEWVAPDEDGFPGPTYSATSNG
ncbi:hypothetical protein PPYR_09294 [Photinus pyralis]|uniref:DDE-1 domain-containing protein n=1 Tax=Photinus pyralis TaxID=7054 RepID=A0A5N4ALW8_PHOPY|nr:hypothetical protein PPYR_09294 [Photinus pyralis]